LLFANQIYVGEVDSLNSILPYVFIPDGENKKFDFLILLLVFDSFFTSVYHSYG
jgi:hypothetical protein